MVPPNRSSRRRAQMQPCAEPLEGRSLMTGGAGNTFALVNGTIATPGQTVDVPIVISPAQFTLPKGKMVLGVDVVAASGSHVQPFISQVNNQHNQMIPQAIHSIYNPHLSHSAVARGAGTNAVLAPITLSPHQPQGPIATTVQVTGQNQTAGTFLLGFYLPGDANGDGTVDSTDVAIVRSLLGATRNSPNYSFDADANRDGRITRIDLSYTQQNLGVKTTVTPLVTANLDPSTDSGIQDRITKDPVIQFQGQGTPGATITFAETGAVPTSVSTTVGVDGSYSVKIPLGAGKNGFAVTSVDGFGQTITGNISAVTFDANAPDYLISLTHSTNTSPDPLHITQQASQ